MKSQFVSSHYLYVRYADERDTFNGTHLHLFFLFKLQIVTNPVTQGLYSWNGYNEDSQLEQTFVDQTKCYLMWDPTYNTQRSTKWQNDRLNHYTVKLECKGLQNIYQQLKLPTKRN